MPTRRTAPMSRRPCATRPRSSASRSLPARCSGTRSSTTTSTRPTSSWRRSTRRSPTGSGHVGSSVSERRRPRIGLSTYLETASWGVWSRAAALVPQVYLDAVVRSGGVPLLLPPIGTDESVVDLLDGLLLIGGADLDPEM